MAGKFAGYWEMRRGGVDEKKRGTGQEIFKCTDCGHETEHAAGHSGAPDHHGCRDGCRNRAKAQSDWHPAVSRQYRDNYDSINWSKK